MKKYIFFTALFIIAVNTTNAQQAEKTATTLSEKDNTTLNVILNPIQTLFINPAQKNVDLVYSKIEDYKDGVSSEQKNHLTIYSTGAFVVQVNSETDIIKSSNDKGEINASTISVQAKAGTLNALENADVAKVSLSTNPTNLINSGTGGVDRNFDITYAGIGADGYVNKYFKDEGNQTIYTTIVTYTIAAQ